jgi:hypothetical protein
MAIVLSFDVTSTQSRFEVDGSDAIIKGGVYQVGSEKVRVVSETGWANRVLRVRRGVQGTTAAPHSGGSGLALVDPAFSGGGAVDSVNGQTGVVVLDAGDVGADVAGAAASAQSASQPADAFLTDLSDYADFPALVDALKPFFLEPD